MVKLGCFLGDRAERVRALTLLYPCRALDHHGIHTVGER